jgi:long-chain fatty acid transport protein
MQFAIGRWLPKVYNNKVMFMVKKMLFATVFSVSAWAVQAGGFYFPEIATPGSVGTAGASNPTNIYDASAALTNPAAMVYLPDEESLRVGFQIFAPKMEFDSSVATGGGNDGGNAGDIAAAPGIFYAKKLNADWSIGGSVAALMGGGVDYGENFVGRYQATSAVLTGAGVTGAVGHRVNDKLTLGTAVTMVLTQFEQDIAVNRGPQPDGKVSLEELEDWSPQYTLSMTYQLDEHWLLGVVYRSKVEVDMKGDFKVSSNLGSTPLAAFQGDVKLAFDAPELLEVGLKYQWRPDTVIFVEADWERFSQFDNNYMTIVNTNTRAILKRNWDDTYRLALGIAQQDESGRIMSAGVSYDSSPVEDEDRTFDLPVDEQVRLAFAYGQTREQGLNYSLAAELIWLGSNKIDQTAQGVRAAGEFDTSLMTIVSGSIDYRF